MSRRPPKLKQGVEQLHARCTICRTWWHGTGHHACIKAIGQARAHAERCGHIIEVAWANRRGIDHG